MFRVYETYGLRNADLHYASSLLSQALLVDFAYHESYYLNEYLLAEGPLAQKITIESNELEDEDGRYLQEEKFPEYGTLIRLKYRAPSHADGGPVRDELSLKLEELEGVTLLERTFALVKK